MKKREYYLVNYPTWNKNALIEGFPIITFYNHDVTKYYQQYYISKKCRQYEIAFRYLKDMVECNELFYIWT